MYEVPAVGRKVGSTAPGSFGGVEQLDIDNHSDSRPLRDNTTHDVTHRTSDVTRSRRVSTKGGRTHLRYQA